MKLSRWLLLIFVCLMFLAPNTHAALKAGAEAPDFILTTTTEDTVSLSDYRGQVVILHYWKSN